MKSALLIFFLAAGIPGCVQMRQRWELEKRASNAARILQNIYVLTPNQSLRIIYANMWQGNVCIEYVVDDARDQSFIIKYPVFEKGRKFVNYDLDELDIEEKCSMAGVDLTNVAEKELTDLKAVTSY